MPVAESSPIYLPQCLAKSALSTVLSHPTNNARVVAFLCADRSVDGSANVTLSSCLTTSAPLNTDRERRSVRPTTHTEGLRLSLTSSMEVCETMVIVFCWPLRIFLFLFFFFFFFCFLFFVLGKKKNILANLQICFFLQQNPCSRFLTLTSMSLNFYSHHLHQDKKNQNTVKSTVSNTNDERWKNNERTVTMKDNEKFTNNGDEHDNKCEMDVG